MASLTAHDFAVELLGRLGAPQTPGMIDFIMGWEAAEGGAWHNPEKFNPLNVAAFDSNPTNPRSVMSSWEEGLTSTVHTIHQSNFSALNRAIVSGDPAAARAALIASPWASSHYGGGATLPRSAPGYGSVALSDGGGNITPTRGARSQADIQTASAAASGATSPVSQQPVTLEATQQPQTGVGVPGGGGTGITLWDILFARGAAGEAVIRMGEVVVGAVLFGAGLLLVGVALSQHIAQTPAGKSAMRLGLNLAAPEAAVAKKVSAGGKAAAASTRRFVGQGETKTFTPPKARATNGNGKPPAKVSPITRQPGTTRTGGRPKPPPPSHETTIEGQRKVQQPREGAPTWERNAAKRKAKIEARAAIGGPL